MQPHVLQTWTQATTYLQLVGILMGQLFFGFAGDWIGRKFAMLADMFIILIGVIMLTVSNGTTIQARPAAVCCQAPTVGPSTCAQGPSCCTGLGGDVRHQPADLWLRHRRRVPPDQHPRH